ncbi:MAG: NAD(P)-dependent oxidoreductase, partial [Bacteroidota bacterium]
MLKIGIIQEGKVPPDSRVPLTPTQCQKVQEQFPVQMRVAPSPSRCYSDEEYRQAGVELQSDLSDCDVLMGVKEVPIKSLIDHKTYFFFSHTIKKQSYNRSLLQAILHQQIRLIDYEVLTNEKGQRLIAFGRFAGMVGAHNTMMTYGKRTGLYQVKRMHLCRDYAEAKVIYQNLQLPAAKIVLTGTGRVASGAAEVLKDMGIRQVSPQEYLQGSLDEMVFTQLDCEDYAERKDGQAFDLATFFEHPQQFQSTFRAYALQSDIMINGIYWDNRAPAFFSLEDTGA